ncbi:hypothetical protein BWQ96_06767 [Gracilariopsis chorda]|uniref:Uncharacterized protein n=1 Tax=Gracilariopsis chorda TaxID=448386 RepID=A0A2V3IN11_9FLOR|nr:hypothetical protein BWQ96_06767 [Gracilariopsis chorda]|eukprot:PXF43474.1 hypothetical protein BWQ96_06767 [Gracilariopsis chorda]
MFSPVAAMEPFTPKGASIFNRFAVDDLLNSFLGGAFVLLILTYITSILNSLLYPTRSIRKRSIDRYIIFSRISSMRGLYYLFKGIEWPSHLISTAPSHGSSVKHPDSAKTSHVPQVCRKFTKLFAPCCVRILLLAAEFAAIYAGTSVSRFAISAEGFDVVILPPTYPLKLKEISSTGCDNFLQEARGQEQAGELLKCVFRTIARMPATQQPTENASIILTFVPGQNSLVFQIRNTEHKVTRVELQTVLNTVDGDSLQLSPVRPDLSLSKGKAFFDAVIDGVLNEWGLPHDGFRKTAKGVDAISMLHSQEISLTQSEIADYLVAYLRALPMSLNSTGPPWVFSSGQYKQRADIRIAVIGINRVAHSILLIVVLVLAVIHLIVQRIFPGFDAVAFAAIQSFTGDSIGIGPTATAGTTNNVWKSSSAQHVQKFSDGKTGHIGFQPSFAGQIPVHSFTGCDIVA